MLNLRPDLDPIFDALGEEAVITVPAAEPVPVSATVVRGQRAGSYPQGQDLTVTERITEFTLRRSEIPSAPSGTTIVIGAKTWTVDSISDEDDEVLTVVVR